MSPGVALLAQAQDALTEVCGPPDETSYVCRQVFDWTENELAAKAADWFVARPVEILVIFLLASITNRLVRRAVRRFVEHAKDDVFQERANKVRRRAGMALIDTGPARSARRAQRADAIGGVMRSVATAAIWSVALLAALSELGINLAPLIAGAGIIGVALGFGAQSLVKDFLSGIFMLIEDQFGIGDVVDVGEATGTVEGISLRTTRMRGVDGTVWHVPNGEIRRVGNKSQP